MSSLLKDAKDFYSMFYKANIWDEIAATKILINLNEYEDIMRCYTCTNRTKGL